MAGLSVSVPHCAALPDANGPYDDRRLGDRRSLRTLRLGDPCPDTARIQSARGLADANDDVRDGSGQGVAGFIADAGNSFDPVTEGYPAGNPTTGFSPKNEGFAGIIFGTATDGSNAQLSLYCFDINTDTYPGINYVLGTWNASNVPNVNYVAQVLNNYYPKTNEPAALTDLNQKAAAVQAAIWFFSDRYVLNTSDSLHDVVSGIAAAVIAKGPAAPPDPPSVNITPDTLSGTGVDPRALHCDGHRSRDSGQCDRTRRGHVPRRRERQT